jgi:septal ring factor EnvC (AmiA/AmiB activator)
MLTYEKIAKNRELLTRMKEKRENLDLQIKNLELKIENQTQAWIRTQSRPNNIVNNVSEEAK